ncbi:MAG: 6-carboxytetrahydropterin synthase [Methanotrichaceae archaeon]|nr:6-carboxytetrahydropterin synthase [Methanotrichaceae archaeon]
MYTLALNRDFMAQHYLIGGDWGEENRLHTHHYHVELQLEGSDLTRHGYLVDLAEVEGILNDQVRRHKDQTLNDLPEFKGLNPSIECFARIICLALMARLTYPNVIAITVKIWENDIAWASYRRVRSEERCI